VVNDALNAVDREGSDVPVKVAPVDFAVHRTERSTQTIDTSRSMFLRGCFLAAKKVAIALDSLIRSQFPHDSLYVVGFLDLRRRAQSPEPTRTHVERLRVRHHRQAQNVPR